MTCPKCQGVMRTYERNGIDVDQCTECRGIFLDRGELERLVDAEAAFHEKPVPPRPDHDDRGGYGEYRHGGRTYPKRKKHFLEQLFD